MSDNTTIFVVVGVVLVLALLMVPWGGKRCECYKQSNSAQFTVNSPKYNPAPPNPPPMMRQAQTPTPMMRQPQTPPPQASRPKEGWAKATPTTALLPQMSSMARTGNVLDNPWFGGFPGQLLNGPNGATNFLGTSAQGMQEEKALMATVI